MSTLFENRRFHSTGLLKEFHKVKWLKLRKGNSFTLITKSAKGNIFTFQIIKGFFLVVVYPLNFSAVVIKDMFSTTIY